MGVHPPAPARRPPAGILLAVFVSVPVPGSGLAGEVFSLAGEFLGVVGVLAGPFGGFLGLVGGVFGVVWWSKVNGKAFPDVIPGKALSVLLVADVVLAVILFFLSR